MELLLPPTQTLRGGVWLPACCRVLAEGKSVRDKLVLEPEAKPRWDEGKDGTRLTLRREGALGKPCLDPNSMGSVSSHKIWDGHPNHLRSSKKRRVVKAYKGQPYRKGI